MGKLILFGCGGHARSVADVALDGDPSLELVFVDAAAQKGETVFGFPVIPEFERLDAPCIVALGDNAARRARFEALDRAGETLANVLSPRARYGREATVGKGTFVAHSAHLGPMTRVGDNTIINTGAILDHESQVGNHCHVGPGVTVSGRSRIGDRVFLGAGATVIDGIRICADVTVGAGSTVIKDITEPGVYVGSPAARKR